VERRYDHTQRAPLHRLLTGLAVFMLTGLALPDAGGALDATVMIVGLAAVFFLLSLCFGHLRVHDAGDALELRFGPLPLATKRVPYAGIRAAEPARSKWIDGWGVHWVPGRGWTWNLWGYDCVELDTFGGTLRIGTDEPERLAAFLRERIAERRG
jgi:hypothetical protein